MKSPMIPLLGLALILSTPAVAQESKDASSTQGVEKQESTAGEITKTGGNVGKTAEDVATSKNGKAAKLTPEQRKCAREVAKEMGTFRERSAQLKRAQKVGTDKNNQELLDKVAELRPKLEAQHQSEIDRLVKTYGADNVQQAQEAILKSRHRDAKGKGLKDKGGANAKKENQKVRGKANQGAKKRKMDKNGGDQDGDGDGKGESHDS